MKYFTFSIIAISLVLSNCGFHLRGHGRSGFQFSSAYIQSTSANKIAKSIKLRLMEADVEISSAIDKAQVVIYLSDEDIDRRVLSVSSITGKQEEFELNYRVEMELKKSDGTVLLEKQKISLLRDYLFDEQAVLAMWSEDEILREEMFNDIIEQIIRRLQIVTF